MGQRGCWPRGQTFREGGRGFIGQGGQRELTSWCYLLCDGPNASSRGLGHSEAASAQRKLSGVGEAGVGPYGPIMQCLPETGVWGRGWGAGGVNGAAVGEAGPVSGGPPGSLRGAAWRGAPVRSVGEAGRRGRGRRLQGLAGCPRGATLGYPGAPRPLQGQAKGEPG